MAPAVAIQHLTVTHKKKRLLWDVHATIAQGSLVGIIGPNGAGKSTLLKSMIDLMPIFAGTVRFFEKPYQQMTSKIAYIPQKPSIDMHFPITAGQVVLTGRYVHLGWGQRPRAQDYEQAEKALSMVNMIHCADRSFSELSGGEQQRIFFARALAQEADVYLLDEPFVGIDMHTEQIIIGLLKKLCTQGKTVLVVHHDLQTVTEYFDALLLLNKRAIACGPTQELYQKKYLEQTYHAEWA